MSDFKMFLQLVGVWLGAMWVLLITFRISGLMNPELMYKCFMFLAFVSIADAFLYSVLLLAEKIQSNKREVNNKHE